MQEYYHVRLAISQYGEQFRAELFTEDLGDTDGDLLKADWDEVLAKLGPAPTEDDAREVGREMFAQMLGLGRNRGKWTAVVAQARDQGKPLRLLVDATTDAVRDLPFGLLREDDPEHYLFRGAAPGSVAIQFVRILRRCPPRSLHLNPGQPDRPIRLLLAVAEPRAPGSSEFAFDAAARLCELARELPPAFETFLCPPTRGAAVKLRQTVAGPPEQWRAAAFEPFCRLTREGLRSALGSGEFDILHLIAHGRGSGVWVCDEAGAPEALTSEDLGPLCRAAKLQMAFLQVCRSGRTGGRGGFGGLAQQLLNHEVGDVAAVVASPLPLDAGQSTRSASLFYKGLAEGKSPDEALDRDRLPETEWGWAFLELWVRPRALAGTGARGAFQFVSPYRGLASFKERDADIFRGRRTEVEKLYHILNDESVVVVVGDSGSGKTSLLQAGLTPRVRREGLAGLKGWRIVLLRPGTQPAKSLMLSLLLGDESPDLEIHDLPAPQLESLPLLLRDAFGEEHPLLLVIDQFEEMFTLCAGEAQRQGVARVLADVARLGARHFRLVLGLRGEYLYQAAALPGLHDLIERPWVLGLPGPDAVRAIVAEPAEEHGYRFEGPQTEDKNAPRSRSLLQRILDDPLLAGDGPTAAPLPLLEFALERLWLEAVERGEYDFTHADYEAIGGLGGAIAGHAEDVYNQLPRRGLGPDAQALAEQIITGLVSSRGARRPRPRTDLEIETASPQAARKVIDHLVGERLLTLRSAPSDPRIALVELTHEVLLERWERLRTWLTENPALRAIKEAFQTDADQWDAADPGTPSRSRSKLPNTQAAKRYIAWIDSARPALTPQQTPFAEELRRLLRRRRRLLVGSFVALLLGVVAVSGAVVLALAAQNLADQAELELQHEAERAELRQQSQRLQSHQYAARLGMQQGKWDDALTELRHAVGLQKDHSAQVRLRLQMVKAYFALDRLSEGLKEMEAIRNDPDQGDAAPSILLWDADAALLRSTLDQQESALARVKQALETKRLPPAEEDYAKGLLADKSTEAVEFFKMSLEKDTFQPRARSYLAFLLIQLGDLDEASNQVRLSDLLCPEDPTAKVLDAIIHALKDDMAGATHALEMAKDKLGEARYTAARKQVAFFHEFRGVLGDEFVKHFPNPPSVWIFLPKALWLFNNVAVVAAGARKADSPNPSGLLLPLHPVWGKIARRFSLTSGLVKLLLPGLSADQNQLEDFRWLTDHHPEGFFLFSRAVVLFNSRQYEEAERCFVKAAEAHSMFPLRSQALCGATFAAWFLADEPRQTHRPEVMARGVEHLKKLVTSAEVTVDEANGLAVFAMTAKKFDLARAIIALWAVQEPKSSDMLRTRGLLEKALEQSKAMKPPE